MANTPAYGSSAVPKHLNGPAEEFEYELQAQEGAIWSGGRLLVGILTFAFAALAFAYFYLRSVDSEGLWRPHDITAPRVAGAIIFVAVILAVWLGYVGAQRLRRGSAAEWQVTGWLALGLLLLGAGLQLGELLGMLPFYPGSSGYASCFVGWAVINTAFILGAAYWAETLLAREMRIRRLIAGDGGAARSTQPVARLFRANLESFRFFLAFVGLVELIFLVLFYVV
ncbi:MAG: hypothetical protein WA751_04075 [Candidatus Dormiibacterota bacterium]